MAVTEDWASHRSPSGDHAVFDMCVAIGEGGHSPYLRSKLGT